MANINKELNDIKNAVYGKEVRGSIHDGIKKINDESEDSKVKADEAHDVMESILDESFDSAALESNFEQKLEDKIDNLQPEWTQFKDDTDQNFNNVTTQLAETWNHSSGAYTNLYRGKKRKMPIVSIISDDGGNSDLRDLHPLLDSKGLRAGLGIITSRVGTPSYMPWEDIKLMHGMGYEIMYHSHTHQNLTGMTEDEMDEEVRTGYEILRDKGYNPTGFIYPFNATNSTAREVVGRYFPSAYSKTELRTQGRNWYDMNNQAIRRVAIGSYFDQSNEWDGNPDTSSLEYYKWRVDEAIENDNWLVLVIHPGPTPQEQWDIIDELLDYIIAENVPIMLPSEAFEIYGNIVDVRGGDEFVVNNEGKIERGFGDYEVNKNVNSYTASSDINDYPKDKVTVSYVNSNQSTGTPTGSGGTFVTFNIGNQTGFQKQYFYSFDGSAIFIRGINAYGDDRGKWNHWREIKRDVDYNFIDRIDGHNYTGQSKINQFPVGVETVFRVNSNIADGFPSNQAGMSKVYRFPNQPAYGKQEFLPYNKSELWIRSADTDGEWKEWVKLG